MAFPVYIELKANGTVIEGGSTNSALDVEGWIEAMNFGYQVNSGTQSFKARPTGRRNYDPIQIVKEVDKSTPLLWKALTENEEIEALFKFFRPSADGVPENYYTIEIEGGRVVSISMVSPDAESEPETEEVLINFNKIRQTYNSADGNNIEHNDTYDQAQ